MSAPVVGERLLLSTKMCRLYTDEYPEFWPPDLHKAVLPVRVLCSHTVPGSLQRLFKTDRTPKALQDIARITNLYYLIGAYCRNVDLTQRKQTTHWL